MVLGDSQNNRLYSRIGGMQKAPIMKMIRLLSKSHGPSTCDAKAWISDAAVLGRGAGGRRNWSCNASKNSWKPYGTTAGALNASIVGWCGPVGVVLTSRERKRPGDPQLLIEMASSAISESTTDIGFPLAAIGWKLVNHPLPPNLMKSNTNP